MALAVALFAVLILHINTFFIIYFDYMCHVLMLRQ